MFNVHSKHMKSSRDGQPVEYEADTLPTELSDMLPTELPRQANLNTYAYIAKVRVLHAH